MILIQRPLSPYPNGIGPKPRFGLRFTYTRPRLLEISRRLAQGARPFGENIYPPKNLTHQDQRLDCRPARTAQRPPAPGIAFHFGGDLLFGLRVEAAAARVGLEALDRGAGTGNGDNRPLRWARSFPSFFTSAEVSLTLDSSLSKLVLRVELSFAIFFSISPRRYKPTATAPAAAARALAAATVGPASDRTAAATSSAPVACGPTFRRSR